ncbi:imm11 family protein [uncultured Winogradskyella sp.]|uniref:imm11 family protein n=1 Tax=uncultured Winogradskyella sp. TaxID=395353 RepID=UPI00260503CF|nr:DUF1629 domain-containing protein [uncultured Winogradskyella sp.]
MYNLLEINIIDEKKHYLLKGSLYDNAQKEVGKIFDDGTIHADMNSPYKLILDESDSLIKNRTSTDMIATSVISAGLLFLISPKAQDLLLELASNDIEMYEVEIQGNDFELNDYKIVKILDKVDCVDLEKSDVDYDEDFDSIDSAEEIVLDESKIPIGKQLFLLGKRSTGIIVVHENLKRAIEEADLTGFQFWGLDEAYQVIS